MLCTSTSGHASWVLKKQIANSDICLVRLREKHCNISIMIATLKIVWICIILSEWFGVRVKL